MEHDVIIAGGGLVGTSLALALAQGGVSVCLVDPAARAAATSGVRDGRGYALNAGSCNLLRALGLWGALDGAVQPILEIKVTDGRAGAPPSPLVLEFDHAEIEEGPMGHMVEDRALRPALMDALAAAGGVTELPGRRIAAQSPGSAGIDVTLDDGGTLRAAALIGCDGQQSGTGRRAGIRRVGWTYGQSSLVATIAHDKPHRGIAYQAFLPEGPLAILPHPGDRSGIVWTERTERARQIQALDDAAYLQVLRPRFGDFLGEISLDGPRALFPLGLSLATDFAAERVALAGDAAHAVHPLAGQGLNAGLKDVAALAEVLVEARRRGEDIGRRDVLARYVVWRRFDAVSLAVATDAFNRLFSNDNPLLRAARDLGMGLVNAVGPLRRAAIREAAGLAGDRPRLLRGRAL